MEATSRHGLWELRRQRSRTATDLGRWHQKSEAKIQAYEDKLKRLEEEIAELEKAETE